MTPIARKAQTGMDRWGVPNPTSGRWTVEGTFRPPDCAPPELVAAVEGALSEAARARALIDLAHHVEFGDREDVIGVLELAVQLAMAADDPALVVTAETQLAFQLNETARSVDAFQHAQDAIAVARTLRDVDSIPYLRALSTRALVRSTIGDVAGARRDYLAILDVPLGDTDLVTLLVARLNISSMYIEGDRPRPALHHLSAAAELIDLGESAPPGHRDHLTPERARYYRVAVLQNRGDASVQLAEEMRRKGRDAATLLEDAEACCAAILESISEQDQFNLMLTETLKSSIERLSDQPVAAVDHATSAIRLTELLGQSVYPQPHMTLAHALEATGRWDDALAAWRTAATIVQRAGHPGLASRVFEGLARSYEQRGDVVAALDMSRKSIDHLRSVMERIDEISDIADEVTSAIDSPPDEALSWRDRLYIAERHANYDHLTGLLNRRGLMGAVRGRSASQENTVGQVALVDVDHFKIINDTRSHLVGDQVLSRLAEVIQAALPSDALVARYGGEEFVVVLDGDDPQLLESVRIAVQQRDWSDLDVGVTVSIGSALLTGGRSFDDALAAADGALYEAKKAGRNRVRVDAGLMQPR